MTLFLKLSNLLTLLKYRLD